jgi:hypothetical protein
MNGNKGRKNAADRHAEKRTHCFYFVKPMPNTSANVLANEIAALKGIDGVYVAEDTYGFLVKARFKDSEPDEASEYIQKSLNKKFNMALSYYNLKK